MGRTESWQIRTDFAPTLQLATSGDQALDDDRERERPERYRQTAGKKNSAQRRRPLEISAALLVVAATAAYLAWQRLEPESLGPGFASGNQRIEATEIDVATKIAGRVREIAVDEGDFVTSGDILARMDTAVLEAQYREAEAQLAERSSTSRPPQAMSHSGSRAGGDRGHRGATRGRTRGRATTLARTEELACGSSTPSVRRYFLPPEVITQAEMDASMDFGLDTFSLVIPVNFQRDLLAGRSPEPQLNVDARA